ncbi:MAG TPA: hypothetical protein VJH03_05245 [Blastocatellia bacterium]|nr:hypothetical protein [Blastocatellia bacterium]
MILRIDGLFSGEDRIPIVLIAEKLQATQRLLYNIGSAIRSGGRRGAWKAEILEACDLVFVSANGHSLEIVTELRHPIVPPLFKDLGLEAPTEDLGLEALTKLGRTLRNIRDNDKADLEKLFPNYGPRARILKSALAVLPDEGAEYEVSVKTPGEAFQLTAEHRPVLTQLAREARPEIPEIDIRTITGRLYLIEVETGQRHLGLFVNNRPIPCYYGPEFEDIVRDLIPGSLVEVEGVVTVNDRGEIRQIEEMIDVEWVPLSPLYWSRVDYQGRRFHLRETMTIQVDFREGLWVYEYEPLRMLGYGTSRAEALNAFRSEFASCWDQIAQESDENLTLDAVELKAKLLHCVAREGELAA